MTYQRFEDLPVWHAAIELGLGVFALTEDDTFSGRSDGAGGIRDQIRRAVISVSNNIAEGFERGSTAELISFLYSARASAGEVRSMLRFLERWPRAAHLALKISELISQAESCSRQIRGWADSLQNSDIKGQRHLNEQVRTTYQARKRADEFRTALADSQDQVVNRWIAQMAQARGERPNDPPAGSGEEDRREI